MSVCTNITKIADDAGSEVLQVTIDNTVTALWFYPLADALPFLNQEVIVDYRKDVYNGQLQQFIKTFTVPTVVNTLDKKDNMKLYLDQVDDGSNLSFNEIAIGETRGSCIFFCTKQEYKASTNAVWMEMLIRDRSMHIAKLRIFDYMDKDAQLAGHYLVGELSRSKWGFQTDSVVVSRIDDRPNPEIDIAKQFIQNFFSDDPVAMQFINKCNLFEAAKDYVDYEPGYVLVRIAMELAMCESLYNITNDVDVKAIAHTLLASYGFLVNQSSVLSPMVRNIFLAQQFPFPDKKTVIVCLDEGLEEHPAEYALVHSIKESVNNVLRIRKEVV